MLLILSDKYDLHADLVENKIKKRNICCFRFNLDVESLKKSFVTFNGCKWIIANGEQVVDSIQITCVWCRRAFIELTLEEQQILDNSFKIWKNEWNKTLLGLYNSLKRVKWLNPLKNAYKGENKYYQIEIAGRVEFKMPDFIVSNQKEKLLDFAERYPDIVLKLISQEIYQDKDGKFKGLYVNKINKHILQGFSEQEENPIMLQNYVDKKYEVRYTVVGKKHFVCKIDSQKSKKACEDWRRYDLPNTPHLPIEPPKEIKIKVDEFMDVMGIEYGALDFIVTPQNEWVFLEINCMGQWLWIENLTGLKISDAIVEWISEVEENIN